MYSEFTVRLINEVKKREILYNNKYDKRPRAEKEKAWDEIGSLLETDPEKCKKHWKNVRDRFVKIKHARDKHFMNNGSELTAPGYIYYDMLSFMTEFSIKKVLVNRDTPVDISEVTPEPLLLTDDDKIIDMTKEFMHEIQKYPTLYDGSAEMRRFRGKDEWKKISDALYSKFTIDRLRQYWTVLMRQYRLYEENRHQLTETVKNENIFNMMSFVILPSHNDETSHEPIEYITFEDTCKMENEDHRLPIVNVIESPDYDESYDNPSNLLDESHQSYADDNSTEDDRDKGNHFMISHGIFGPEPKKARYSSSFNANPTPSREKPGPKFTKVDNMDEYDYFGKKVAMQLRNLASVNSKLSRKAEIEVLQLLMKFEESAEGNGSVLS